MICCSCYSWHVLLSFGVFFIVSQFEDWYEKGQELGEVIGALEKFGNKHLAGQPTTKGNDCSRSA